MSAPVLFYTADGQAVLLRRPIGFARAVEARPVEVEAWKSDETLTSVTGALVSGPFRWWWETDRQEP